MKDKIKFVTKSLNELSTYEVLKLRQLCLPFGAFKVILRNLTNESIKNPDSIFVTIAKIEKYNYIGWFLEDVGKEYNPSLSENECSIHIYTAFSERGKGLAAAMVENRLTALRKYAKIIAYVGEFEPEKKFFQKMKERHDLELEIRDPIIYISKKKEIAK